VELLHKPIGEWSGAFGVQIGGRDFAALGEEAFVPPVDTKSYGVFMVEERELARWRVALGARFEAQEHAPAGGARVDDDATSLSFAAVRPLTGGRSLVANLAVAERLPVAEELFALPDVPHLATGMFQVGDPTLGVETARHVDLGLRRGEGDVRWSVTGFLTDYDDFIFLADTGVVVDEIPVFAFRQRGAEFTGLEAEVFAPIADLGSGELDLRVFGDYVKGKLAGGEDLPRIPPLRYGARLQYHDTRFLVGVEATRYDKQTDTASFEEATAGYTMADADFRWRIERARGMPLDLFVKASNLSDEEARKHTTFVKDVAPLPGRNYAVGVRTSW
jgi:iron complex outermembrane receptor protein